MAAPWDSALDLWGTAMSNNFRQGGTTTTRKNLSQEAIDKLIYDALSSEQGLAQLVSMEGLAGGRSSTTKTLQAQDFMTKIIGELANITAEQEQVASTEKTTKEGRFLNKFADSAGTVICTELVRQGKLDKELYEAAGAPLSQVSLNTWKGYYVWASRVVPWMQKSERISNFLLPVARARYELMVHAKFSLLGLAAVWIGHPICWLIGAVISAGEKHGRLESRT